MSPGESHGEQPLDPVALLLPEGTPVQLDLASRLTRAMEILSSDAVDSGSPSVRVQLPHARRELGVVHHGEVGALLEDLLIHTARRCYPAATFLTLPATRHRHSAAWARIFGTLSEAERQDLGLDVPRPGESPLSVLERLVASFRQWAAEGPGRGGTPIVGSDRSAKGPMADLWNCRLERLRTGAGAWMAVAELESPIQAVLAQLACPRSARERQVRQAALADLVALRLDCGDVQGAGDALRRAGPTAVHPADCGSPLDVLGLITRWLMGGGDVPDLGRAFQRCTGQDALPGAWREVERHHLGRRASPAPPVAVVPSLEEARQRQTLGARALVVSLVTGEGFLKPVVTDVAPGLKGRLDLWARRHRHALGERGTPEHEAGRAAEAVVFAAEAGGKSHGETRALGRFAIDGGLDSSRVIGNMGAKGSPQESGAIALVVQPLLDPGGELLGLLWIELAHRLLPAGSVRLGVATAFTNAILQGRLATPGVPGQRADGPETEPLVAPRTQIELRRSHLDGASHSSGQALAKSPVPADFAARGEAARVQLVRAWEEAVQAMQFKTAERRWIAFHVESSGTGTTMAGGPTSRLVMAAQGGDAGDRLGEPSEGGTWALRRALRTGGPIRYGVAGGTEAGHGSVMLHGGAVSGAAIPLRRGGRVVAVLSVESARQRDAREKDVERWYAELEARGAALEAAFFSADDRRAFDGGFALCLTDPDVALEFEQLCSLGASPSDLVVTGPVGSGRKTTARLLHHVYRLRQDPGPNAEPVAAEGLAHRSAFGLGAKDIRGLGAKDRRGTLLISDLEWLCADAQAALLGVLCTPREGRPRLMATLTEGSSGALGANDALHPELQRRLARASHRCVALSRRRHTVPGLARFLIRRIGDQEGGPAAELTDGGAALLWRQDWQDNVTGLEATLYAAYLRVAQGHGAVSHGEPVELGPSHLQAAMLDGGAEPVGRVPSRNPRLSDLHSALWATQTATKRFNKTRAAMYLGWDPNTLATRLKEEGIDSLAQVADALRAGPDG